MDSFDSFLESVIETSKNQVLDGDFAERSPADIFQELADFCKGSQTGSTEKDKKQDGKGKSPAPLKTPPKGSKVEQKKESQPAMEAGDMDVYGTGKQLNEFEAQIAKLLGKQSACFLVSGIMAQQIALKVHSLNPLEPSTSEQTSSPPTPPSGTPRTPTFACHPTCHLEILENQAYDHLLGFQRILLGAPDKPISFDDVKKIIAACKYMGIPYPFVIILELPYRELGGILPSFEEIAKIRLITLKHGIKLHLDGARLWECKPLWNKNYGAICELFDSVFVSFYKGLGGLTGSMLLGDTNFIQQSRIWLRRFGGNVFTYLPLAVSAQLNFNKHIDTFNSRYERLKSLVHLLTLEYKSTGLMRFNPPVPQVPFVHLYLKGRKDVLEHARDEVKRLKSVIVFTRIRKVVNEECYVEWKMGPSNMTLPDSVYLQGWKTFFDVLEDVVNPKKKKELSIAEESAS